MEKEVKVEVIREVKVEVIKEVTVEVIREVIKEVPVEVKVPVPTGDAEGDKAAAEAFAELAALKSQLTDAKNSAAELDAKNGQLQRRIDEALTSQTAALEALEVAKAAALEAEGRGSEERLRAARVSVLQQARVLSETAVCANCEARR